MLRLTTTVANFYVAVVRETLGMVLVMIVPWNQSHEMTTRLVELRDGMGWDAM